MEEDGEAGATFEDAGKAYITFRPGRPLGMKLDKGSNAVQEVSGGQAEKAGVRVGWILKKVAGKPFTASMLKKALKGFEPVNCLFELPDDDFTKRIPKQSIDVAGEAHVWISTDLNQRGRKRGATSSKRTVEVKTSRKRGASTRSRAKSKPRATRQNSVPKPQHKRARSDASYASSPAKRDRKISAMMKEFDLEKKQMKEDFEKQLEELKQENARLQEEMKTGGADVQSELKQENARSQEEMQTGGDDVQSDLAKQVEELKAENEKLKESLLDALTIESPKEKGGDDLNDADMEIDRADTDMMADLIDDMDSVGKEKRMNAQLDQLRKQDSIKFDQEKEKMTQEFEVEKDQIRKTYAEIEEEKAKLEADLNKMVDMMSAMIDEKKQNHVIFEVEKEQMLNAFEEEKKQIADELNVLKEIELEKNKLQEEFDIHVALEHNLREEIQQDLDRIHILEDENKKLQEELTNAKSAQEIEHKEIESIKTEHEEEVNEFENDKWEMVEEFAEEREALRKEVEDVKKQLEEMRLKLEEQKRQNSLAEDEQQKEAAKYALERKESIELEDTFNGIWKNKQGQVLEVEGRWVNDTPILTVETPESLSLEMGGKIYSGTSIRNGNVIEWNDGDEWTKELSETPQKRVPQQHGLPVDSFIATDNPTSISQEDMDKMLAEHQNEKQKWMQNHEELKKELTENHEEEKKKLVENHAEVLTRMATSHENEKKDLKRACQFLKESVESHQQEKQEIHDAHSKEKQKLKDVHAVQVEKIKREFEEEKIALSEAPDSIGELSSPKVDLEEHETLKQQLAQERRNSMTLMEDIENAKTSAAKIQAEMVRQAQKAEREKTKEKTKELKRSKKIMIAGITQLVVPKTKDLRTDFDAFKNEITEQHKQFLAALEEMQKSITSFK